eukprot:jgi/Chlat1/790/Chrsp104S01250
MARAAAICVCILAVVTFLGASPAHGQQSFATSPTSYDFFPSSAQQSAALQLEFFNQVWEDCVTCVPVSGFTNVCPQLNGQVFMGINNTCLQRVLLTLNATSVCALVCDQFGPDLVEPTIASFTDINSAAAFANTFTPFPSDYESAVSSFVNANDTLGPSCPSRDAVQKFMCDVYSVRSTAPCIANRFDLYGRYNVLKTTSENTNMDAYSTLEPVKAALDTSILDNLPCQSVAIQMIATGCMPLDRNFLIAVYFLPTVDCYPDMNSFLNNGTKLQASPSPNSALSTATLTVASALVSAVVAAIAMLL